MWETWEKYLKERKCWSLSRVLFFVTPWTVACQAPLSMKFSGQESWIAFPFPSPGDLPNPEIKPRSSALQADSSLSEPPGKPIEFLSNLFAKAVPMFY